MEDAMGFAIIGVYLYPAVAGAAGTGSVGMVGLTDNGGRAERAVL
jgi:hypothetical protein